jgi:organic radical activating enzyme
MKIVNVRFGFASNSSSSHSIVFVNEDQYVQEVEPDWGDQNYGWDDFTLVTTRSKHEYLAQQIKSSIGSSFMSKAIAKGILNVDIDIEDGGVDHQSVLTLPKEFSNPYANAEFLEDFAAFLNRPDVVVLGGNDNSDGHPLRDETTDTPVFKALRKFYYGDIVARKDGDWWTLFSRKDGKKIKFSFLDDAVETRPEAPELIDIKVSDYCPYGCSFCYQGSTVEGKHAVTSDLTNIANQCEELKVFEVAFGGGEPTLHPEFKKIVERFHKRNIVVNFTTRNHQWVKQNYDFILKHCGAVAFSTEDPAKILAIQNTISNSKGYGFHIPRKVVYHYVMGSTPLQTFEDIMRACDKTQSKITLLGYKTTGRGDEFEPHDYSKWEEVVKKLWEEKTCPSFGIDTALANESKLEGVPKWLYYTTEGSHSFYIDAVAGTYAPSSFCGEDKKKKFDLRSYDGLKKAWDNTEIIWPSRNLNKLNDEDEGDYED